MNFQELKDIIKKESNKKTFIFQIPLYSNDIFHITSSLYNNDIPCYDVMSVNDIYNIVNKYSLDQNLFKKPFYITVYLKDYNENTINIINNLDNNFFIEIVAENNINDEAFQKILKIKRSNCIFKLYGRINIEVFEQIIDKFNIYNLEYCTLIVDKVDRNTMDKIKLFYKNAKGPKLQFEIKDLLSLQNLEGIIQFLPEPIIITLDNSIFNENNPHNARNLLFPTKMYEQKNKQLNIYYENICFDSMGQVFEFEKNIELIKSHIPTNSNELDIVTYISLFMINYFKFDEKMINDENVKDINLAQFISKGKGVCRHFADFTKHLLNSLGIECETIKAFDNFGNDGHAFNVVKINNNMYFIDNTWLTGQIHEGIISSPEQSFNFLTSNTTFGHEEYSNALNNYQCEYYPREDIIKSINTVLTWNQNYKIHAQALKDLFRKHILKKQKNTEAMIEQAIPRRF